MNKRFAKVSINNGTLNVRTLPMGAVINGLKQNEIVEILDEKMHSTVMWYKIKNNNMTGYAISTYLKEFKPEQTMEIEQTGDKPIWLEIAEKEIGVKEIKGAMHNNRIIEYHKSTEGNIDVSDELPWCASFVNWCMTQAGFKGTNTKRVKDWIEWGEEITFDERKPGAIVIFQFKNGGNHIAFLKNVEIIEFTSGQRITCIGGNQSNQVKYSNYLIDDIVSLRWPV